MITRERIVEYVVENANVDAELYQFCTDIVERVLDQYPDTKPQDFPAIIEFILNNEGMKEQIRISIDAIEDVF